MSRPQDLWPPVDQNFPFIKPTIRSCSKSLSDGSSDFYGLQVLIQTKPKWKQRRLHMPWRKEAIERTKDNRWQQPPEHMRFAL